MRKEVIAPLLVMLMLLAAVGYMVMGNDETGTDLPDETDENQQMEDEWDVYYVESGDDLPSCGSATLGRLYFVASTSGFETCTSAGWAFVNLTGPAGPAGSAGSDGGDGTQGPTGSDGADGTQGPAGAEGDQGPAGANGTDGADGADGANGQDGEDGEMGMVGSAGNDGYDGMDGHSVLAVTTPAPAGTTMNCTEDGIRLDVGVDVNDNGSLESNEIHYTQYICNGENGAAGVNGTNGSASPNTMLTSISSPAASLECTAGGRVIKQGLDNGDGGGTAQNGVLESGEVDYTTTYCSTYEFWQVADLRSGTGGSSPGSYMAILVGDTLYFSAYLGSSGTELWAQDTSNSSTWQVADISSGGSSNPGYYMAILVGDTLYFDARITATTSGYELWAHDTSNSSTWQVTDINSGTTGSFPGYYMEMLVGDTLYFSATDGISGHELWAHDTSTSSTWRVADIWSGLGSSNPGQYMAILVGDTLYFSANDGSSGDELWAHDTSTSSTWQVAEINPNGTSGSYPGSNMAILVGDTIYFDARAVDGGWLELWALEIEPKHSITYY